MRELIQKRWFLIAILILVPGGLALGYSLPKATIDSITAPFDPRITTAFVLFLMAFSLDSQMLWQSFRAPGPVLWATAVNFAAIPVLGMACMPFQLTPDFRYGLMIAATVPCTMAAASVWTRKAGGNDAVSLLTTVVTNGACFLVTPFWLHLSTGAAVNLDVGKLVWGLVQAVLIPTLIGQAIRQFPAPARLAVRYKTPMGVVAQACILCLVFTAACNAGQKLAGDGVKPGMASIAVVWTTCLVLHIAGIALAVGGAKLFGMARGDRIAVAFAGSQKTLPIGVMLATEVSMFGNPNLLGPGAGIPFAVFPMLMYHGSQLFIDTAVADYFAHQGRTHIVEPQPAVEGAAET